MSNENILLNAAGAALKAAETEPGIGSAIGVGAAAGINSIAQTISDPTAKAATAGVGAAISQIAKNPTTANVELTLETLAEQVASVAAAQAGPLAMSAETIFGHVVISGLFTGLFNLYAHIGAAAPAELHAAKSWLDKHTGGIL